MQDINLSHLNLVPNTIDLVIYHGKCCDGFGSALASYEYFKFNNGCNILGNKVEYFPATFNQPPPSVIGKNVIICDFSYKKDVLLKMISEANSLAVIDHHKTAEAELKDIPDKYKIFRMDHSGAYLTWKYFFPTYDVPLLIQYIEDNDIWLKAMPYTREVTSYIFTLPYEFEEYSKLLVPGFIENNIIPIATGMQKQNNYYIDNALSFTTLKFVQIGDEYYFVVHLNSSILKSEIGNSVLYKYPNCDFSAIYSTNGSTTYYSLRSDDSRTDVSQIALKFGGGGHRNASGITTQYGTTEFPGKIIDNNILYGLLNNIYTKKITISGYDFNVVYFNTTHNKKHIGKYLLQTRTTEKLENSARGIQQTCSIIRNKLENQDYYDTFAISCVWNYDGLSSNNNGNNNGKTWFSLNWNNSYAGIDLGPLLKNKFNKEDDYQYIDSDKRIIFTKKGNKFCL